MKNVDVEYTVSDMSALLASRLAQSYSYKNMPSKMYDISKPAAEQGLELGYYDIITGLNVLHAVPDIRDTLSNLNSLLKPGGRMLVIDSDGDAYWANPPWPGMIWSDYVFGSFFGWFGYTDDRKHCTMGCSGWNKCLIDTGFRPDTEFCTEDAGMTLMFHARKP